jgi:hypothetical protein
MKITIIMAIGVLSLLFLAIGLPLLADTINKYIILALGILFAGISGAFIMWFISHSFNKTNNDKE